MPPSSNTPKWIEKALLEFEPDVVERYRNTVETKLDRALQGISDSTKIDVLRLMINLNLQPDDPTMVIVTLYGYIKATAETVPTEIRASIASFSEIVDKFNHEAEMFPEIITRVIKSITDDLYDSALEIGQAAVRSAGAAEIEQLRFRIAGVSEKAMREFLENALKERQLIGTDQLILRGRIITAGAALVVFIGGWAGGATWGVGHAHLTPSQEQSQAYGQEFARMYPTMPTNMQSWIKKWTQENSGR